MSVYTVIYRTTDITSGWPMEPHVSFSSELQFSCLRVRLTDTLTETETEQTTELTM
jgi:hypothetical protein